MVREPPAPLDGSWEHPGRRPVVAAVAGLVLCGAVYSAVGGAVSVALAVADLARGSTWVASGRLVDLVVAYYRRFQVPILVLTTVSQFAIFLGLAAALVRRWHSSRPSRYLRWRPPRAADVLLGGLGGVAIVPLADLIGRFSYVLLPPLRELDAGGAALLAIDSPWRAALVIASVAVTPAVCEETLFRGWLYGTLRRRLAVAPAVALQAVLFALFHMSPLNIVALTVVGLFLAFLVERTGTLAASSAAHGLYNGAIVALVNLQPPFLLDDAGRLSPAVIAVSFAVLAGVVAALLLRARGAVPGRSSSPPSAEAPEPPAPSVTTEPSAPAAPPGLPG